MTNHHERIRSERIQKDSATTLHSMTITMDESPQQVPRQHMVMVPSIRTNSLYDEGHMLMGTGMQSDDDRQHAIPRSYGYEAGHRCQHMVMVPAKPVRHGG